MEFSKTVKNELFFKSLTVNSLKIFLIWLKQCINMKYTRQVIKSLKKNSIINYNEKSIIDETLYSEFQKNFIYVNSIFFAR